MSAAFGNLVERRRLAVGLSQEELGALVDRSPSTIRSWERGNSAPAQDGVYEALATALEISEAELRAAATSETTAPTDEPSEPDSNELTGRLSLSAPVEPASYRDDPRQMATYWIRALLTAAALIVLFVVLVWAGGALFENLGDVLQVFRGE